MDILSLESRNLFCGTTFYRNINALLQIKTIPELNILHNFEIIGYNPTSFLKRLNSAAKGIVCSNGFNAEK